jgi:hypothetical protein
MSREFSISEYMSMYMLPIVTWGTIMANAT